MLDEDNDIPLVSGADAIIASLLTCGVDTCFANPGTSELPFVAALDRTPDMRAVLALHENVATGAADGFARMRDLPAVSLLHLGPGFANGLSCLHNARRARTPVINLIGEHATSHLKYDAPLTTDVEAIARPFSDWVRTTRSAEDAPFDTINAFEAAQRGRVASLILPADSCWDSCPTLASTPAAAMPQPAVPDRVVEQAAQHMRAAQRPLLLLGGLALRQGALNHAAAIAERTGAKILAATHNARVERGAGRVAIDRLPYPVAQARALLAEIDCLILVGAPHPVAFFAYPEQPSDLVSSDCRVLDLCSKDPGRGANANVVLAALSEAVGGTTPMTSQGVVELPSSPHGALTPDTIARSLCRWMPDQAIIAEDAVTSGRAFFPQTENARPHDWLQTTGGAIGHGLPMATGAAVACPDRKVVCLQADGAGMYTLQALWTQAREDLDVTTIIFANRKYAILRSEFENIGISEIGSRSERLTSLDDPTLDWTALAQGMGVSAQAVETAEDFDNALKLALSTSEPFLIEARIP